MSTVQKPATRLYVPDDLKAGVTIVLSEAQAHQLRSVLRLQSGALVALFNGRDGEWIGETAIEKRQVTVRLLAYAKPQIQMPAITLAFAPIKQERLSFLVEKATELGVTRLSPILTARTQVSRINGEKLRHIAREAAEQCERLDLPAIDEALPLARWLQSWPPKHSLFVCAEAGEAEPAAAAFATRGEHNIILVGPEGGFSPEEFAMMRALDYARPISLGPLILRAETAALAALACWQSSNPYFPRR